MRCPQSQTPTQPINIPPAPATLWSQLPPSSQQQLAHLVAELLQRVRQAAKDKESDHEH
jgi:hypothetical protein